MQPFQMEVCQQQKNFPEFISAVMKSKLNFEHFQRKDDVRS